MRKIDKSPDIPQTLRCASVPANADEVNREIYRAEDVRRQLIQDQHHKCAYCECAINEQYNDVEHYRPKSIYYWLGHEWSNLLYACNLCNRTYKKDNFPLTDEGTRDVEHRNISKEVPLLINPSIEDPLKHLRYNRYIMLPLRTNGIDDARGSETLRLFHLNDRDERAALVTRREEVYELYEMQINSRKLAEAIIRDPQATKEIRETAQAILSVVNTTIARMKSPAAEFSGMLTGQ